MTWQEFQTVFSQHKAARPPPSPADTAAACPQAALCVHRSQHVRPHSQLAGKFFHAGFSLA